MKVYTKIVYDKDDNIIEEHSYNYEGLVAHAKTKKVTLGDGTVVDMGPMEYSNYIKKINLDEQTAEYIKSSTHTDFTIKDHINTTYTPYTPTIKTTTPTSIYSGARSPKSYKKAISLSEEKYHHDFDGINFSKTDLRRSSGLELTELITTQTDGATIQDSTEQFTKADNELHQFASYNTLFTLSALTEEEIKNPRMYLNDPVHDVIAQSAGIGPNFRTAGKDPYNIHKKKGVDQYATSAEKTKQGFDTISASQAILARNHDIFFEDVNITSTVSPGEERNTMSFTKIDFELHEPYSISFVEKMRAAAYNSGYKDYLDAPFLLTIEWKGWRGEKAHSMEVKSGTTGSPIYRKIPIVISRVEFDVNEGGARYQIQGTSHAEFAMMDRFHVVRQEMTIQKTHLAQWGKEFSIQMEKQQKSEVEQGTRTQGFEDVYVFEFDEKLQRLCANLYSAEGTTVTVGPGSSNPRKVASPGASSAPTNKTNIPPNTSVMKVMEDTIMATQFFQDLVNDFWLEYLTGTQILSTTAKKNHGWSKKDIENKEHFNPDNQDKLANITAQNTMIPWFKIISSVHTQMKKDLDPITRMQPKTIVYKAVYYEFHILKLLVPGMSIGRVDWEKTVQKRYNYLYTGENLDIQNLRINYKTGYYHRNVVTPPPSGLDKVFDTVQRGWRLLRGNDPATSAELTPLRSYPSLMKSTNITSGMDEQQNVKVVEFYDYLVNPTADMMRLEMEILGDPCYVAQDMYVGPGGDVKAKKPMEMSDGSWNKALNCFNIDNAMPIIHLKYRMPADPIEKTGTMFDTDSAGKLTAESNLFFSGIYQVSKVESSFKSGQFIQILHMVRLNGQQGPGTAPFKVNHEIKNIDKVTEAGENQNITVDDVNMAITPLNEVLKNNENLSGYALKIKKLNELNEALKEK